MRTGAAISEANHAGDGAPGSNYSRASIANVTQRETGRLALISFFSINLRELKLGTLRYRCMCNAEIVLRATAINAPLLDKRPCMREIQNFVYNWITYKRLSISIIIPKALLSHFSAD